MDAKSYYLSLVKVIYTDREYELLGFLCKRQSDRRDASPATPSEVAKNFQGRLRKRYQVVRYLDKFSRLAIVDKLGDGYAPRDVAYKILVIANKGGLRSLSSGLSNYAKSGREDALMCLLDGAKSYQDLLRQSGMNSHGFKGMVTKLKSKGLVMKRMEKGTYYKVEDRDADTGKMGVDSVRVYETAVGMGYDKIRAINLIRKLKRKFRSMSVYGRGTPYLVENGIFSVDKRDHTFSLTLKGRKTAKALKEMYGLSKNNLHLVKDASPKEGGLRGSEGVWDIVFSNTASKG